MPGPDQWAGTTECLGGMLVVGLAEFIQYALLITLHFSTPIGPHYASRNPLSLRIDIQSSFISSLPASSSSTSSPPPPAPSPR